jgi:hypothetical protein
VIVYSTATNNSRMTAVANAIGSSGQLQLKQGSAVLASVRLNTPCGTVADATLTFTTTPALVAIATATGAADTAAMTNAAGNVVCDGLTVGTPGSSADVLIANGISSTVIAAGQAVQLIAAEIRSP